ncbi:MAG: hypothetical protein D3910_26195 [Candidatus Electrothrix sp. ATG2]|nr:hypothetical protein [Candidatus Electrothrix sp. ATG2]
MEYPVAAPVPLRSQPHRKDLHKPFHLFQNPLSDHAGREHVFVPNCVTDKVAMQAVTKESLGGLFFRLPA